MLEPMRILIALFLLACVANCYAQGTEQGSKTIAPKVVDIPTRPGVSQRVLVLSPAESKATVVLLAGGHGGLRIAADGSFAWGAGNFLVRSRQLFADQGLLTIVVDAPSDRQNPPYLSGFRTSPEHVADIKAVMAWAREQNKAPVWLVGTSRGTESAAFVATQLIGPEGPDGLVLTSTILTDNKVVSVPAMALSKIRVPVLVVHHIHDGCSHCSYSNVPALMAGFTGSRKKQLLPFQGGTSRGDPCEARAYHGFNGLEARGCRPNRCLDTRELTDEARHEVAARNVGRMRHI